jgi:hypothetical protein
MNGTIDRISGKALRATLSIAALTLLLGGCVEDEAPRISGIPPAVSVKVGDAVVVQPEASDPQGDALTFSVNNAPGWTSFDASTGTLSGVPNDSDVGVHPGIRIEVSDGKNVTLGRAFSITVEPATQDAGGSTPAPGVPPPSGNSAPTLSGAPATSVEEGQTYLFRPSASDPDGDSLSFNVFNKPGWARFDAATGELSGTPGADAVGVHDGIVISVTDGELSTALPAFRIMVVAINRAPTISGTPATRITSGQNYSFQPAASDPEGQPLAFSITNLPSWASFDVKTGRLSGTPSAAAAGDHPGIVIGVSDGELSSSLPAFAITVVPANRAPTISGAPATTVTAGQAYAFQPTASDPDGDALTFNITNKPAWAAFDPATGRLTGTPSEANEGEYIGIAIGVTDGELGASLSPFSIVVDVPNRAPTISGTPPTTVKAGQDYVFQPTASDPDGDALTFSIGNKPAWVTFSPVDGRLSGQPGTADVGSYAGIVVRVSDGTETVSLPGFTINVEQSATGTATISWSPPTERTDGTPLTDLAGYRVHYGKSATDLSTVITVDNSGITSYVIEGLTPGTWYFATTAFDDQGMESDFSNVASKAIP